MTDRLREEKVGVESGTQFHLVEETVFVVGGVWCGVCCGRCGVVWCSVVWYVYVRIWTVIGKGLGLNGPYAHMKKGHVSK